MKFTLTVTDSAMVSRHTYVLNGNVAVDAPSKLEESVKVLVDLRMQNVNHFGFLGFKRKRFEDHVIRLDERELNEGVAQAVAPEGVRQLVVADLALENLPKNACVVRVDLSSLLGLEPTPDTVVVDEADSATASEHI